MSTHSNIAIKLKEEDRNKDLIFSDGHIVNPHGKAYMYIYCHFDGYVTGVGEDLLNITKENKWTYDDVLKFILEGDRSIVKESYVSRGENWEDDKPKFSDEPPADEYYVYCFIKDRWYMYMENGAFVKLDIVYETETAD